MRLLAMIHAKKESKRFPGKHQAKFRGKVMVEHLIEQAQRCAMITDIVVCTDDGGLMSKADRMGVWTLGQTPLDESKNQTVRNDMIPDTIKRWHHLEDFYDDIAWLNLNGLILAPTIIPGCAKTLLDQCNGRVQTVERVDHHHPNYLFHQGMKPYCMSPEKYTPSQQFELLFAGIGACIGGYDPHRDGPRAGILCEKFTCFELHDPIELEVARGLYDRGDRGDPSLRRPLTEAHQPTPDPVVS